MSSTLASRLISRATSSVGGETVQARTSVDFLVDGMSLLEQLVKASGGHGDFMGCFVQGFPDGNQVKLKTLLAEAPAETEDGRVLLYVCPECGDIGCGAYAVRVRVSENTVEWSDFAYENGYEPSSPIAQVGPFVFNRLEYEVALNASSAASQETLSK